MFTNKDNQTVVSAVPGGEERLLAECCEEVEEPAVSLLHQGLHRARRLHLPALARVPPPQLAAPAPRPADQLLQGGCSPRTQEVGRTRPVRQGRAHTLTDGGGLTKGQMKISNCYIGLQSSRGESFTWTVSLARARPVGWERSEVEEASPPRILG